MASKNLSIPDDLAVRVDAELPGLNLSALLRDALVPLLRCSHDELRCSCCGGVVDRRRMVDDALGAFYKEIQWKVREAISAGGTLEGYAGQLKRAALGFGVSVAGSYPIPRTTRVERQRALDAKLAELPSPARRRRIA